MNETLTGSASQVEWAERIKLQIDTEFNRVASCLRLVDRPDIDAIIAILERKRSEVMAQPSAGYFIRDWQEMSGQVRQLICRDSGYQALMIKVKSQ